MDDEFKSKDLEFKDYWAMVVRRRWSLLGPFFLLGWLGFAVAHWWPYLYRSEALILVEQQKVPEQYVTPNVISDLQDRLQSMTQQILSRTRLQRLIEQFNLYSRERARMIIEDVVNKMREDIRIEPMQARGRPGELTAFRISYGAKNPRVAQQVTNELTSLFIEENLQARTQQSVGTTAFLENQLEQARKDLAEQEQRQREYKLRYLGQLPEQQQSNLQILSSLEAQLHATTDSLDRAEQQKIYLESMRDEYKAMQSLVAGGAGGAGGARAGSVHVNPVLAAEAVLSDLRNKLADLEANYTPRHPDVVRFKEQIVQQEALKRRLEAEQASAQKAEQASAQKSEASAPAPPATADPTFIEAESRLKAVLVEIRDREKEMDALRTRIKEFQSRLNLTPVREQQLTEVTRAYENSRQHYQSLLQKKLQSELATNLEKRQQGEQFRILDPASLPEKPDEPSRLEIILIGWALGLCGGIGLAAFLEFNDESLRSEKEVSVSTQLPVLVRIPVLHTPREEIRQRRYRSLEVAGVTLLILLSVSTGVYTYLVS